MSLTFDLGGRRRLKIADEAVAKMLARRQLGRTASEAGGVLLGRRLDGGHVIIDDVTEPQAGDRAGRFTFHRSADHQALIDEAHLASGGTCGYLGEWHTHAEPDPTPSDVDLDDWLRRVREDVFDGDELLFVIVGQERLRVWTCDRPGKAGGGWAPRACGVQAVFLAPSAVLG